MATLKRLAAERGLSFTAFVKRELPGWPSYTGPQLTIARAEAICAKHAAPKVDDALECTIAPGDDDADR